MVCGVQVSTFRPFLDSPSGVRRVFQGIAAMDCGTVQLQGIKGSSPKEVADALSDSGLRAVSIQEIYSDFVLRKAYCMELSRAVGARWLTVSRIPAGKPLSVFASELVLLDKELRGMGQRLAFHPVREDFPQLEPLLSAVSDMDLCLDLYHLWRAGENLPAWAGAHRGRIKLIHYKDALQDRLVPAGRGEVPLHGVLRACPEAEYAFVEQETWEGDPYALTREALTWLKKEAREL